MIRQLPGVVTKPRWLLRWARAGCRPPSLEVPNLADRRAPSPTFFGAYGEWMQTPPPTWDDVAWLSEQWSGPLMLKGVMRTDDAKRAIDAGVTAISVSNHGGNNLDGSPAPIRVLRRIAEAVGDQVEVVMDGGVRRGSDVVKAVALGARAVMIGRAACGDSPPPARRASRTSSTSCTTASTRRCWAWVSRRSSPSPPATC